MPKPDEPPPKQSVSHPQGFKIALAGASLCSWCFLPPLRWRPGVDQPGYAGLGALVVMGLYAEATRSDLMLRYIQFWLVALAIMRICRDKQAHSHYAGWPWLAASLPPVRWIKDLRKKEKAARWLEPALCLAAGWLLCRWDRAFGSFVYYGAFSMAGVNLIHRMIDVRRRIAVTNAMREGEQFW